MLAAGLAQAEQSPAGALAAASLVGGAFAPGVIRRERRRVTTEQGDAAARGIGGGDIKVAALLGSIAGVPAVFAALSVAVIGGAFAAAAVLVVRRHARADALPYGPFLAGGAMLVLL